MDFLLDETGDIQIKNGDFVIGDSDSQEIELLVMSNKGVWKENPTVGAGIMHLVKSRATETRIKRDINEQLSNDGFINIDIDIKYPDVTVDAKRIQR